MIENVKNLWKNMKEWDMETLVSIRFILFIVIVLDLVGIYWYLQAKKLAISILIVSMAILGLILYLQNQKMDVRGHSDKMDKKKKRIKELKAELNRLEHGKKKKKRKKPREEEDYEEEEEEEEEESGFGFGLPDADEYQKRTKRALGGDFGF